MVLILCLNTDAPVPLHKCILYWDDCNTHMGIGLSIMSQRDITLLKPKPTGYPDSPQTLGEHIRRKRMDKGISQVIAAKEIGVSKDCLCNWEQNRNQPRLYQYPAIFTFLGYYPFDHETESFGGMIKRYK